MVSIQASGNVTYVGDASSFVFQPGSNHSITDLFPSFKNCMPGDTLTEQIEIRNESDKAVDIYMKVEGGTSGIDFLKQMDMEISNNNQEIFHSSSDTGMNEWILIGSLDTNASKIVDVTLNIPIEMDDKYQDAIGVVDWSFKVEENKEPTIPNKGTKTGLNNPMYGYGSLILLGTSLFLYKRQKSQS